MKHRRCNSFLVQKLAKKDGSANVLGELRKQQVASNIFLHELTAKLKVCKSQLIKETAEKLEFSTKLNDIEAELYEILEEFAVLLVARDFLHDLVQSIIAQSFQALYGFII